MSSVQGLPPDLSSGDTLTPWECQQRIDAALAHERAEAAPLNALRKDRPTSDNEAKMVRIENCKLTALDTLSDDDEYYLMAPDDE